MRVLRGNTEASGYQRIELTPTEVTELGEGKVVSEVESDGTRIIILGVPMGRPLKPRANWNLGLAADCLDKRGVCGIPPDATHDELDWVCREAGLRYPAQVQLEGETTLRRIG